MHRSNKRQTLFNSSNLIDVYHDDFSVYARCKGSSSINARKMSFEILNNREMLSTTLFWSGLGSLALGSTVLAFGIEGKDIPSYILGGACLIYIAVVLFILYCKNNQLGAREKISLINKVRLDAEQVLAKGIPVHYSTKTQLNSNQLLSTKQNDNTISDKNSGNIDVTSHFQSQ